jgi:hypothetical protein
MTLVFDVIFILSLRFFLFDMYVFKPVREWLRALGWPLMNKWLICPFCHGFWCGCIFYAIMYGVPDFVGLVIMIEYGFVIAFLSFTWVACMDKAIRDMENKIVNR